MKTFHLLVASVVFTACASTAGSARPRDVTLGEARQLVALSLAPAARRLPGLEVEQYREGRSRAFYWLTALANVRNASPILGHFAVSRATGEVWDAVACRKVESAELLAFQKELRHRIGIKAPENAVSSEEVPCEP